MNSNSPRSLAALAVLFALHAEARAQVAVQHPQTAVQKSMQADTQARITAALDAARQRVLAGDLDTAAYDELVSAIRAGFAGLTKGAPDANAVRTRIVAAVDDIYKRAKQAKISPDEFAALRVDVLDAHLEELLQEAGQRAGEKANLDPLAKGIQELADAAQEVDPADGGWRTRAQALLDGLKAKQSLAPADLEPLQEELLHARAVRAESLLEKHATGKGATPTDFARARNHLADEFERDAQKDPQLREQQKKLVAAIDALEKRAAESALTPADFEALRKQMAVRTHAALAEKAKPRG